MPEPDPACRAFAANSPAEMGQFKGWEALCPSLVSWAMVSKTTQSGDRQRLWSVDGTWQRRRADAAVQSRSSESGRERRSHCPHRPSHVWRRYCRAFSWVGPSQAVWCGGFVEATCRMWGPTRAHAPVGCLLYECIKLKGALRKAPGRGFFFPLLFCFELMACDGYAVKRKSICRYGVEPRWEG